MYYSCMFVNLSIFECANQLLADSHRYIISVEILSYFWFNYFVYFHTCDFFLNLVFSFNKNYSLFIWISNVDAFILSLIHSFSFFSLSFFDQLEFTQWRAKFEISRLLWLTVPVLQTPFDWLSYIHFCG